MRARTSRAVAAIRQRRFPPEFRIAGRDAALELRATIEEIRSLATQVPSSDAAPTDVRLDDRVVARLATGLWRARRRMCRPGSGEPLPEMRQPHRHVQSAWDELEEAGVLVQDHDGDAFASGLALQVVAFQPEPGLTEERVIETVRPSIYRKGRVIQMGEVIVGTPDERSGRDAETLEEGGQR